MYLKNDISGEIGTFTNPQEGFSIPTQAEITAFLLGRAKITKIQLLKNLKDKFLKPGHLYNSKRFALEKIEDIVNLTMKGTLLSSAQDRYKYDDKNGDSINFTDTAGMTTFRETMLTEWDRVIRKEIAYKKLINACNSISGPETPILDDIIINFSA